MKLLYPEIDTWVYNMQKTDPSIKMLPMSLSHPGMLKMSRVVFPPAQKAVTAYEGHHRKLSPQTKGTNLLFLRATPGG